MVFDPLIITAEDFFLFCKPEKEIGVCLDTAHYGITKKTISESFKNKNFKIKKEKMDLVALPEEDVKLQPDLIELAEKLGNNLLYIHFCDFKNTWMPDKVYSSEGVVPGQGDFGGELKQFLKYLNKKEIPVLLEINDKDFKVSDETKKSIKWLINNI